MQSSSQIETILYLNAFDFFSSKSPHVLIKYPDRLTVCDQAFERLYDAIDQDHIIWGKQNNIEFLSQSGLTLGIMLPQD